MGGDRGEAAPLCLGPAGALVQAAYGLCMVMFLLPSHGLGGPRVGREPAGRQAVGRDPRHRAHDPGALGQRVLLAPGEGVLLAPAREIPPRVASHPQRVARGVKLAARGAAPGSLAVQSHAAGKTR